MKNLKSIFILTIVFIFSQSLFGESYYYPAQKHSSKKPATTNRVTETKKVKLIKKKRIVKKVLVQKEETEEMPVAKDKKYIKNCLGIVKINRVTTLETKNLSGTSVNLNGDIVAADGNTYASRENKQSLFLALGYGTEKEDGVFYDGSLVIFNDSKDFDFSLGIPVESLNFHVMEKLMEPYIKVMAGISYDDIKLAMPDGISFGSGLGFNQKSSENYSFGFEGFYKTKFYRGVESSYGTENTKEEVFGVAVSLKYYLN